jgi:RND family efflux transporter MFP subunit
MTATSAPDSAPTSHANPDDDRVPVLEPALWKQLGETADLPTFCNVWLTLQCGLIGGVAGGGVVIGREAPPIAVWPQGYSPAPLLQVIALAGAQRRGVVHYAEDAAGDDVPTAALAFPVAIDDEVCAVAALALKGTGDAALRQAMRQLQWGVSWLRARLLADRKSQVAQHARRAQTALDTLSVALEQQRFASACRALVTDLASRFSCERVSIGFVRRKHSVIAAISHSAKFGQQMNLVRLVGGAMNEALDQRAVILYPPPPDEPNVTRAHADLAKSHGAAAILTTPLFVHDRFIGAVTFERADPFDADTIATLDATAAVAGPILEEKRRNDRWLIVKIVLALWTQIARLLGPGHAARKLVVAASIALTVLFYFWTDTYRVTSDATIEGQVQRAVVAPFNGFILEAPARAGDTVKSGQMIARLDDRDLVLERLKWVTERQRKVLEYEKAMGERNRTEQKISTTQIEQAEAQVRLVDEQLARAQISAPFDGVVISGDLTQSIGAAVQRGQSLFEIAPLDRYRVALDVDESQIADVAVGQHGQLVVSSLPNDSFALEVTKITPVSKAHEGRNTFLVEARLATAATPLRPGMHGVAKIDVERRRTIWIWTRAFVAWARLIAWRWSG